MAKDMIAMIWLDDERAVPGRLQTFCRRFDEECDVLHARNYREAITRLEESKEYSKTYIFFDHDLGVGKNGYDVAKYIVENSIPIDGFEVHSMNPVGRKNITELLTHYGYKEI